MAFSNNIMIVRHRLLTELVTLWNKNELVEKIDRLPIELSPRKSKHAGRCCVHKERAVWKYKSLPLLGLDMNDEKDELTPLSTYAKMALDRAENGKPKDSILCVIDEACSACVQVNYEITNLCRGCTARSCQANCPKNAVHVRQSDGKAWIDHSACISCGICHKSCPYHAIVYIPVPCEEVCPVKAIKKDADGIEHIDESKCIFCGKCLNACAFGAIFEVSHVFDVLQKIRNGNKMVAIVAPSILGQFKGVSSIDKVYGAFKQMGFTDVIEVAQGAMDTVSNEAHELIEKLDEGQPFMTTSCCPSYIELVEKHLPDMKKYVSTTGSPMYYAARIAKQKYPDAEVVFVGPCVAKRKEAKRDEAVDYVITFEESASIFSGLGIEIEEVESYPMVYTSVREAHGFAQAGGIMGAVQAFLKDGADSIHPVQFSDFNKKSINLLRTYAKTGKAPGDFIEVMACEGGCITGPSVHSKIAVAKQQLVKELAKQQKTYDTMDQ
ncbi:MAG: monomeric [FeFe] hydrogenase [Rikenellaceae bacterium]